MGNKTTPPQAANESFVSIKERIIAKGIQKDACQSGLNAAKNAETPEELLIAIKDNIVWCISNDIVTVESLETDFGNELLWTNNMYTQGEHTLSFNGDQSVCIAMLGTSSATVKTCDSSSATVETWGSSSATVETCDSSSATVKTWGSSSATVETWGSSSATVETCDSSSATVKTCDSSSATVETWGSSSATVETWDSSSKLTYSLMDGNCPTIKDLSKKKLFVKTSLFEVVMVDKSGVIE